MNEQCRLWTCRSRCWTKSQDEMPANTSPMTAPAITSINHGWGRFMSRLPAEHGTDRGSELLLVSGRDLHEGFRLHVLLDRRVDLVDGERRDGRVLLVPERHRAVEVEPLGQHRHHRAIVRQVALEAGQDAGLRAGELLVRDPL